MKIGILGFTDEMVKACYTGERQREVGRKTLGDALLSGLIERGKIVIDDSIPVSRLRTLLLDNATKQTQRVKAELEAALSNFAEQKVTHLALGSLMMERYLDLLVELSDLPIFTVSAALSRSLISRRHIRVGVITLGDVTYPRAFHRNMLKQGITVCLPKGWGEFHSDYQLVLESNSDLSPHVDGEEFIQGLESLLNQQVSALIYGTDAYVNSPPENLTQKLPDSLKYMATLNPYTEHINYVYSLADRDKS